MSKPNKYNASGMGAQPKLNTNQLYNGPARPGGSQPARISEGTNNAHPGVKASAMKIRETPRNQHGTDGRVEPSAKQPNGSVRNS
jgi:hypothetical protein